MVRDEVAALLERFGAGVREAVPLVALWAHGSLALGDFQPGRSDLDLVAVVGEPLTTAQRCRLQALHGELIAGSAEAGRLHCSYVLSSRLADASLPHLTWAHRELFERPVSPVTRRELLTGGLCLYGQAPAPAPDGLLPAVSDGELAGFVRADLRDFWHPATGKPWLWTCDVWVDLGMLTVARATVTLRDGRLITKGEALDVLAELGAPAEVVRDIRARRYDHAHPGSPPWRRYRRARLARGFVRAGIERTLADVRSP